MPDLPWTLALSHGKRYTVAEWNSLHSLNSMLDAAAMLSATAGLYNRELRVLLEALRESASKFSVIEDCGMA
jgi:hypothetical protein